MDRMKFDYDTYYDEHDEGHVKLVQKMARWKAKELGMLIESSPTFSILEIGAGRGDVVDGFGMFEIKIATDFSPVALKDYVKKHSGKSTSFEFRPKKHRAKYSKADVRSCFKGSPEVWSDASGSYFAFLVDAMTSWPLEDDAVDCVILCDIIEHVEDPKFLLKEAARVGKYVLLKAPVEDALILNIVKRLTGVKYGYSHPSGHLYRWTAGDIKRLVEECGFDIEKFKFLPVSYEHYERISSIKAVLHKFVSILDKIVGKHRMSRWLLGGNVFVKYR